MMSMSPRVVSTRLRSRPRGSSSGAARATTTRPAAELDESFGARDRAFPGRDLGGVEGFVEAFERGSRRPALARSEAACGSRGFARRVRGEQGRSAGEQAGGRVRVAGAGTRRRAMTRSRDAVSHLFFDGLMYVKSLATHPGATRGFRTRCGLASLLLFRRQVVVLHVLPERLAHLDVRLGLLGLLVLHSPAWFLRCVVQR